MHRGCKHITTSGEDKGGVHEGLCRDYYACFGESHLIASGVAFKAKAAAEDIGKTTFILESDSLSRNGRQP